jgi:hypothetical protein
MGSLAAEELHVVPHLGDLVGDKIADGQLDLGKRGVAADNAAILDGSDEHGAGGIDDGKVELLVPDGALRLIDDRSRLDRRARRKLESHVQVRGAKKVCPREVRSFNDVNMQLQARHEGSWAHSTEADFWKFVRLTSAGFA